MKGAIAESSSSQRIERRRVFAGDGLWALVIYIVAALVLFGSPLFHSDECLCAAGPDTGTWVWAFEWWPHALWHGLNPFTADLLFAPEGINLAHGQIIPAAALLLAPVTAVAGPQFSLNLAMFLSPVLASFFAFLLCRRVTRAFAPSLVGGWLFGFSTYTLAQMTSHLNLALIFPLPAIAHLVLRRVDGDIARRRFIVVTSLALIVQFGFSPELFVSFVGFGALALAIAAVAYDPAVRSRIRGTTVDLAAALGITAVVVSPYLYYAAKPGMLPILPARTERFSNDLLGFAVPAPTTALGGESFLSTTHTFTAGFVEGSAYLGAPLLVVIALALVGGRRRPVTRVLGGVLLIAVLLSLGSRLHVGGHRLIPLPWAAANELTVTGDLIPARFSLYVFLCAAVLVAIWVAERRRQPLAWALVVTAIVALWPATGSRLWHSHPATPALFTAATYRHELTSRDTVLVLPIGIAGNGMLWQAEADLRFRMAGGYIAPPEAPDPYKGDAIYPMIAFNQPVSNPAPALQSFLERRHITAVVLAQQDTARPIWLPLLEGLGWTPREIGGATLLRKAPPVDLGAARMRIRVLVTDYLRRLAVGDAAGACRLISPEGIEALTKTQTFAATDCEKVLEPILQSPRVREDAHKSVFGRVTITGTRGTAVFSIRGQGDVELPVRAAGQAWLVDGPTVG